jgi:hypothetical protein
MFPNAIIIGIQRLEVLWNILAKLCGFGLVRPPKLGRPLVDLQLRKRLPLPSQETKMKKSKLSVLQTHLGVSAVNEASVTIY